MKSILDNKRNDALSLLNSGHTVAKIVRRVRVSKATKLVAIENKRYCVQKIAKGGLGNAIQAKEELSHSLKINVSADTVRRTLKNYGLGALPKVKKPDISDDNAKERLLVLVLEKRKHGGCRIMVWCEISYSRIGWLCKIEGNLNSRLYKSITDDDLEKCIDEISQKLNLRSDQVILYQDNHPKHTSKLMKGHFKTKKYEVMSWPAQSPDLNQLKIRRNEYDKPPKDFTSRYYRWYEICVVKGNDPFTPVHYSTQCEAYTEAFKRVGVSTSKVTHANRKSALNMIAQEGVAGDQQRRVGRWGTDCRNVNYFLARSSVIPQMGLQALVFPDIEYWQDKFKNNDGVFEDIAGPYYLLLLSYLRVVFLKVTQREKETVLRKDVTEK
ncbi:hypothetical protein INT46_001037, partial [Mucor plumbeus]